MLRTARYGLSARNTDEPENAADAALKNYLMLQGAVQNPAVVPSIRGDSWQRRLDFAYTDYR
jgi:hypothetical protein